MVLFSDSREKEGGGPGPQEERRVGSRVLGLLNDALNTILEVLFGV